MSKPVKRVCSGCGEKKSFRADQKYCSKACTVSKKPEVKEVSEVKGDAWTISLPKTRIKSLEQLLKAFEIDLSIWEVERFVANKWEMGSVNKTTDDPQTTELYQVKAFLKRRVQLIQIRDEIDALVAQAKEKLPEPKLLVRPTVATDTMLEINLTDHHFGKLAWGSETGYSNYDVKIAAQVFNRAIDTLLDRSPFKHYGEIWFVVGNDLFNNDDVLSRTTSGTQVESDIRHERTYVVVRSLLVQAIEQRLRPKANKVKIVVVPGNHDHNATWHLGDSLQLYFSKHEDVEVDNRPCPRKYHVFGNVLVGYTHGDKGKLNDLPLLMATEMREVYGITKFHEWHTGHIHTLRVNELHGIRVRTLPALCSPDSWHAENGYVGNLRSSEAFVWDRTEGLIGTVIYTDDDSLIEKSSPIPTEAKN